MARPSPWRIRVLRSTEDWVEVLALDSNIAYEEAAKVPGVLQVFGGSAIRADHAAVPERPAGVED
jgi:hypothetical protein